MRRNRTAIAGALALLALPALPAGAQTGGPRPNSDPDALPDGKPTGSAHPQIEAMVSIVSDYRFRGVDLSDRRPAIQSSVEVAMPGGSYAGLWASTLARTGPALENDPYVGYRLTVAGVDLDAGIIGYLYPGHGDSNTGEAYVSAAHDTAIGNVRVGASITPTQHRSGSVGSYVYGEIASPLDHGPMLLRTHLGYERGSDAGPAGRKLDWLIGVEHKSGPMMLSLGWTGTDAGGHAPRDPYRQEVVAAFAITL